MHVNKQCYHSHLKSARENGEPHVRGKPQENGTGACAWLSSWRSRSSVLPPLGEGVMRRKPLKVKVCWC
ncbi:hypothetical protein NDU88_005202 [Pleurodeles waltl]|uniref:Uncharacterized protein n=1 Tax=Pleurodeles waltl TaxID=8319 RepID=A0AAV7LRI3_PLEWA|nr:hypothetical protein NDU88_005202 [Pleurodeles waltl]